MSDDDLFSEIMKRDGVTFPEAVERAAAGNVIPFPVRETPPMSQLADELRAIATEITQDGPTARRAASLRRIAGWLEREDEVAEGLLGKRDLVVHADRPGERDDELPF
jgi:hypothetical protein